MDRTIHYFQDRTDIWIVRTKQPKKSAAFGGRLKYSHFLEVQNKIYTY